MIIIDGVFMFVCLFDGSGFCLVFFCLIFFFVLGLIGYGGGLGGFIGCSDGDLCFFF